MSALTDVFTAIANAIRGKNGTQNTYTPSQMAQAITDIPSGGETIELASLTRNIRDQNTGYLEHEPFIISVEDYERVVNLGTGDSVSVFFGKYLDSYIARLFFNDSNSKITIYNVSGIGYSTDSQGNTPIIGVYSTPEYNLQKYKVSIKRKTISVSLTISTRLVSRRRVYWISECVISEKIKYFQYFRLETNSQSAINLMNGEVSSTKSMPTNTTSYSTSGATTLAINVSYSSNVNESLTKPYETKGTITVTYSSSQQNYNFTYSLEVLED